MIVRTLLLSVVCLAVASDDCVDKQTNVINVIDGTDGLPITTKDGAANTYDSKSQASCHGNAPDIKFPGSVTVSSGLIKVSQPLKLVGNSRVLLTLKKNSKMIGTVCQNGKSKHFGIPSKYCQPDPCKHAASLCTLLETPGTYDLAQVEETVGVNGTFVLPQLPSILKGVIKGEWKVEGKLVVNNEVVAHLKIPSGDGWIYLEAE
ncbi:unnamed protein product [Bursaphelenchus xylophilus]|uniref:(pine wood nematode) hypothetical protein n=1 Tax=Bursaphelenchus xylophilus TaxID=6326 RepID=A0A1I7RYS0_BURXY|nr:unnamed protein product [Bursaphelenchus xylophilus]CAG9092323.1 unnamed protein product [Bursaphelenchus xylophilus]